MLIGWTEGEEETPFGKILRGPNKEVIMPLGMFGNIEDQVKSLETRTLGNISTTFHVTLSINIKGTMIIN